MEDDVKKSYEDNKRIAKDNENVSFLRRFGYIFLNVFGDMQNAESVYKSGLEVNPDSVDILSDLANFYIQKNRSSENQAARDFQEEGSETYWQAREYLSKARLALNNKIEKTGETAQLLVQLGENYLFEKDYETATNLLTKALEKDQDCTYSVKIFADLGVLCIRKKDYDSAAQYFHRALDLEPGNFTIASNLAEAYLRMDLLNKAEQLYKDTLNKAACHVESNIGLGEVYIKVAEKGDADMYKQAVYYLSEAVDIAKAKQGSKLLRRQELAEVLYLRGYARTKLFEASRSVRNSHLLALALSDFRKSLKNSSQGSATYFSSKRAYDKLESRFNPISSQSFSESIGRLLVMASALGVFGLAQVIFVRTYLLPPMASSQTEQTLAQQSGNERGTSESNSSGEGSSTENSGLAPVNEGQEQSDSSDEAASVVPFSEAIKEINDIDKFPYTLMTFGSLMFLAESLYVFT